MATDNVVYGMFREEGTDCLQCSCGCCHWLLQRNGQIICWSCGDPASDEDEKGQWIVPGSQSTEKEKDNG